MFSKDLRFILFFVSLLNMSLLVRDEPLLVTPEVKAFENGSKGNIGRYYQLIEELEQPTGSPVVDQYILGILKGNHNQSFVKKYFGENKYSNMILTSFCIK